MESFILVGCNATTCPAVSRQYCPCRKPKQSTCISHQLVPLSQLSKACPFQIAKGLNPSAGNYTWKIPQNTPTATYFIRSLVYMKNASDHTGASDIPVAIGDSKGFFEVSLPKKQSTLRQGLIYQARAGGLITNKEDESHEYFWSGTAPPRQIDLHCCNCT